MAMGSAKERGNLVVEARRSRHQTMEDNKVLILLVVIRDVINQNTKVLNLLILILRGIAMGTREMDRVKPRDN